MDAARLLEMNQRFGEEEAVGAEGAAFFRDVLDATFCFRRGDGTVADKDAYLKGLADPGNSSELLETEVVQVQVLGAQAFVEALVRFRGTRNGTHAEGVYRNLRLFEQRDGDWRCVMWFNKRIDDL